ncbi:uncharacterized protein J3D65DRAFT_56612 [Phyllosticta citribraziliensis]|uniref:Uncharacterized protein n=1 Tax=Phyllosticta citribraziliensis TaxID=989973 RepID=A0ABR1LC55_9PEZI
MTAETCANALVFSFLSPFPSFASLIGNPILDIRMNSQPAVQPCAVASRSSFLDSRLSRPQPSPACIKQTTQRHALLASRHLDSSPDVPTGRQRGVWRAAVGGGGVGVCLPVCLSARLVSSSRDREADTPNGLRCAAVAHDRGLAKSRRSPALRRIDSACRALCGSSLLQVCPTNRPTNQPAENKRRTTTSTYQRAL